MTSNLSSEYKVVADKLVSPDEDIIVQVRGAMYKDSIQELNRYATMSDIGEGGGGAGPTGPTGPTGPSGPTGPAGAGAGTQTWTAPNDSVYEIHQAHGGIEVQTLASISFFESVTAVGSVSNTTQILVSVTPELHAIFTDIFNGVQYLRSIVIDINGQTKPYILNGSPTENQWYLGSQAGNVEVFDGTTYGLTLTYGGAPVLWWDADTLGIKSEEDLWYFRGAKIDYHAYSTDSGSIVGTIYIADDSGDNHVTHIEVGSGGNDLGTVSLWNKPNVATETQLYVYRADGESSTTRIQWTAQVYYSPDVWD